MPKEEPLVSFDMISPRSRANESLLGPIGLLRLLTSVPSQGIREVGVTWCQGALSRPMLVTSLSLTPLTKEAYKPPQSLDSSRSSSLSLSLSAQGAPPPLFLVHFPPFRLLCRHTHMGSQLFHLGLSSSHCHSRTGARISAAGGTDQAQVSSAAQRDRCMNVIGCPLLRGRDRKRRIPGNPPSLGHLSS